MPLFKQLCRFLSIRKNMAITHYPGVVCVERIVGVGKVFRRRTSYLHHGLKWRYRDYLLDHHDSQTGVNVLRDSSRSVWSVVYGGEARPWFSNSSNWMSLDRSNIPTWGNRLYGLLRQVFLGIRTTTRNPFFIFLKIFKVSYYSTVSLAKVRIIPEKFNQ